MNDPLFYESYQYKFPSPASAAGGEEANLFFVCPKWCDRPSDFVNGPLEDLLRQSKVG